MIDYEDTVTPTRAPCDHCGVTTEEEDADTSDGMWICEPCGELFF
jgi:hypothetical protein